MPINKPAGVKLKMRESKLTSDVKAKTRSTKWRTTRKWCCAVLVTEHFRHGRLDSKGTGVRIEFPVSFYTSSPVLPYLRA